MDGRKQRTHCLCASECSELNMFRSANKLYTPRRNSRVEERQTEELQVKVTEINTHFMTAQVRKMT